MENQSLTKKTHWDTTWGRRLGKHGNNAFSCITERFFLTRRMDALFKQIIPLRSTFLEIGCGGSHILPRVVKRLSCNGCGIDYSETGIELCRNYLKQKQVEATLVFDDLFTTTKVPSDHFDVVYSAGFIEHFTDIPGTIRAMQRFVRPGGILMTMVPNLHGMIGTMHRLADRELFDEHTRITPEQLDSYHAAAGLSAVVPAFYYGSFCLTVVNWNRLKNTLGFLGDFMLYSMKIAQELTCLPFQFQKKPPESKQFSPYVVGVYKK